MTHLFQAATVNSIKQRVMKLQPESERQWGKMNPAQAAAHCSDAIQMALGDIHPPRMVIGRMIGWIVKPMAFKETEPMRRNSPTVPSLVVSDERELVGERDRLCRMIDRFAAEGPQHCTKHPHSFFGVLTPEEWAVLMYKHLDHHLRQFGV